jgi:glycosyltransferase involved in cell wall biosynthesis
MANSNDKRLYKSKGYSLGIAVDAIDDEGRASYLVRFLNVLRPISKSILVVGGGILLEEVTKGNNVHVLKVKMSQRKGSPLIGLFIFLVNNVRLIFKVTKVCREVDILVFLNMLYIVPLLFSKLIKKKIIVIVGGLPSKTAKHFHYRRAVNLIISSFYKTLESLSLHLSDRILVESKSAINFLGLTKYVNKISIFHLYMDTEKFKVKKSFKNRKNLVAFISRLNRSKGIVEFIEAIPMLFKERRDLSFLIGGDGPMRCYVEKELHKNKLYDKVELKGWIAHDKLPDYLNEVKLLVLPSYSEGLPSIVLEAMACGTLVLASPVGAIPDLVKDGETGFILEDRSPEYIAQKVLEILSRSDLEKIASNARRIIEVEYSYERSVGLFKEALERLM